MGNVTYLLVRDTTTGVAGDLERERLLREVREITSRYGLPA